MPVDSSTNPPSADGSKNSERKKKQLAIVALLLVGLLIAVVTQPSAQSPAKVSTAVVAMVPSPVPTLASKDADAPRPEFTTTRELAGAELDEMLQANLFFIPEPEPDLEVANSGEQPPELTVQAIYGSGSLTENQSVAEVNAAEHRVLIGKAIIRTGEVLPDGRQIVRVTSDGVELAQ